MFWEIFYKLCSDANTKPLNVVKQIGISHGSITKWKRGAIPSGASLQKIADYFDVSVDYLLGKEKKPSAPEGTESMGENEKRLFAIWDKIPEEQKPELLNLIEAALRMQQGNSDK